MNIRAKCMKASPQSRLSKFSLLGWIRLLQITWFSESNLLAFLLITITFIQIFIGQNIELGGCLHFSAVWTVSGNQQNPVSIWKLNGNVLRERQWGVYWMFLSNIWLNCKQGKANPWNSLQRWGCQLNFQFQIIFIDLKVEKHCTSSCNFTEPTELF